MFFFICIFIYISSCSSVSYFVILYLILFFFMLSCLSVSYLVLLYHISLFCILSSTSVYLYLVLFFCYYLVLLLLSCSSVTILFFCILSCSSVPQSQLVLLNYILGVFVTSINVVLSCSIFYLTSSCFFLS